jgi:acyl carrier protein
MNDMNEKIKKCFENLGMNIDIRDNFLLEDFIADSITYISLLVELEEMFTINIPDDYLVQGRLVTYQDLYNMIADLIC